MKKIIFILLFLTINIFNSQQFNLWESFYQFNPNDFKIFNNTIYSTSGNNVYRFVNGSWEVIASDAFPYPFYKVNELEIVSENLIYAAAENSGVTALFKVWNGINWKNVGTLPSFANKITDIQYISQNNIYIACQDAVNLRSYILHFNGSVWIDLNLPSNSYLSTKIHYVNDNEIYLSWQQSESIMKYNGSSWELNENSYSALSFPALIRVTSPNNKYITGSKQLKNFASGNFVDVGNLYNASEIQGTVDYIVAINSDNIFVSVRRWVGYSYAFFVSHWDGNKWTRLWTYDSSDQVSDYLSYFDISTNYIYAKIFNDDVYRLDLKTLSTNDSLHNISDFIVYPNPAKDFIMVKGLKSTINFIILNINGEIINKGIVSKDSKINVKNLKNGLYILNLENGKAVKFLIEKK